MATGLVSASGLLSLLDESEDKLKVYALEKLNDLVDEFWAEISDNIQQIEELNENEQFTARELAALVASKVYYHIGSFKLAMIYALGAGRLFDLDDDSQYVKTLTAKCIDEYIRLRTDPKAQEASDIPISELEKIVDKVFEHSYENSEYKYALGIALEARRLDRLEEAIKKSDNESELLSYCFKTCMDVVLSRDFRQTVLATLARLYRELAIPDWIRICEILIFLDDVKGVADILWKLLRSANQRDQLIAYQIAFDLCDNASQHFRLDVHKEISGRLGADDEQARIQEYYQKMLRDKEEQERHRQSAGAAAPAQEEKKDDSMDIGEAGGPVDGHAERLNNLKAILSGATSTNLFLEFLHRNNRTDMLVLKNIKAALESRSSIVYSSIIICHGFINAGTTNDYFLRDNLEWLSRATNWSKFSATASIGVLQRGHFKESLSILAPYLPQQGQSSSPYSEGGALYALGIIHANHGEQIADYLKNALLNAGTNEIVQHGACLGLGVAAMATKDMEIYEHLKNVVYTDSAVAGEAAGIAMGLVMLGSASDAALSDMLGYAHETQHEKIIRGLAMGIALTMASREEEADTLIQQLILDKDPILRYGGMYTVALAYCGTANDAAIRKLLHVAVSDVSNDVRRAAVIALGFVLLNQPDQCPKLVNLLAESYNPHVRYGATLAVGISCAGTGLKSAVDLLESLTADSVDYVRQGAMIALAMVLGQISSAQEPRVEKVRKLFVDTIADKHEDIMAKFGACLAAGIIDAGGRNSIIAPRSVRGHINSTAVVGLALFTQYWYWHPLAHFLSLSFTPTAIIGLDQHLKMPVFKFKSNARPSLFAYPPKIKPPATKAPTKVQTAELSITKKAKIRQRQKEKEKEGKGGPLGSSDAMDVEKPPSTPKDEAAKKDEDGMDVEKKAEEGKGKEKAEKEKEPEPESEVLGNPARVTLEQLAHISFDVDERYSPVKSSGVFGIAVLFDRKPDQEPEYVVPAKPPTGLELEDEGDEPAPPEPFEYDPAKEK